MQPKKISRETYQYATEKDFSKALSDALNKLRDNASYYKRERDNASYYKREELFLKLRKVIENDYYEIGREFTEIERKLRNRELLLKEVLVAIALRQ